MKFYYGVFTREGNNIPVSIPDVEVCETFGKTWDEAYEMGVDALAGCLSVPETIVHPKSTKEQLQKQYPQAEILPVPVDETIIKKYVKTERFNVIFPEDLLSKVDQFRAKTGMKLSQMLAEAAEQFMENQVWQ